MDFLFAILLFAFYFKNIYCVPGDPVMFLPPLELRVMDPRGRSMFIPFVNTNNFERVSQPFASQVQSVSQPQMLQHFSTDQVPSAHQSQMHQNHNTKPVMHHLTTTTPPPSVVPSSLPLPVSTPVPPTTHSPLEAKKHNFTFNEFVEALNLLSENEEEHPQEQSRASEHSEYTANPAPYPSNPPYSAPPHSPITPYPSPAYGQPQPYPRPYNYAPRPPTYQPAPPVHNQAYLTPAVHHHPSSKTFDVTSLLKPVTTKVASKVSGLIGLVLALLTGGSADDSGLKGFKDILINGIIKPLLVAKGGIKSLVSKLVIPIIAILLINVEVLITIWWLWEECPEPYVPPPPAYPSSYAPAPVYQAKPTHY